MLNPSPYPSPLRGEGTWPVALRHLMIAPEGRVRSRAQGNDMVEAIHLALQKIGTELYMSRHHHDGTLSWKAGWTGYNFPLPKNGRDLLIGHDQRFFGLDAS